MPTTHLRRSDADAELAEIRGRAVTYHGSKTDEHGKPWTVRGLCADFDECENDPWSWPECGYEAGHRWMLIGPARLDGRHPLLVHVRRESFTVAAD